MRIRIRVETEFGWGETRSHDLGTVECVSIGASEEDFGPSLRHVETTVRTLLSCLESFEADEILPFVRNLGWRVWPGQTGQALEALKALFMIGMRMRKTSVGTRREAAFAVVPCVMELRTYLEYNRPTVANYARRMQQRRATSTYRAEGLVNDIANSRMGKKQRMRWSPRGAHNVAIVRAAVLDRRLSAGRLKAA